MRFPRYWCRVENETGMVIARGWSETSYDEALSNANNRLDRILNYLRTGKSLDEYQYVIDNVICEEVIDRIMDGDQQAAVISRNAYGSIIMNTTRLMFIDIDKQPPNVIQRWMAMFSSTAPDPDAQTLDMLRSWQQANQQYTLRVYRTYAGYRVLIINHCFTQVDNQVLSIMEQLDSDRLYRQLCRSQSCFRARLSPKPWRVDAPQPDHKFPFRNQREEQEYQRWHEQYTRLSTQFSVCHYLETIGHDPVHPNVAMLIDQHDAFCCGDRPLA